MMVGSCLYSVVVGLLRHLLIATTQLSELEGASTDAQSPSATLLLLLLHMAFGKESMINRLSNIINRNRSAAKISQVLCSTR